MAERVVVRNPSDGGLLFWLARLYAFGALVALTGVVVAAIVAAWIVRGDAALPDWRNFQADEASISRLLAADGTLLGEFADEYREIVPLERIPERLINAVLAIEDRAFWEHGGISYRGIARAAWANFIARDVQQGGSTITQQVIKQYAGGDKTLQRKLREAILARSLEIRYSKRAILSVYLNKIAFGAKAFGVAAAAKRYFQKSLADLTLAESALIAGLPQAPSAFSPLRYPERAVKRRNLVLDAMVKTGAVSRAEADAAKAEPLVVRPWNDVYLERMPYYAAAVRALIERTLPGAAARGVTVETAADPSFEAAAADTVDYAARNQDRRQGWRGPEAKLTKATDRETFLARQQALYGDAPLTPGRRYLALVESVTASGATLRIGSRTVSLPLENMRWAARWQAGSHAENDRQIAAATDALHVHDVVWVEHATHARREYRAYQVLVNPNWLPAADDTWDRANPSVVRLAQAPYPQAAIFSADYKTGYVQAMAGGSDFRRSQLNRVWPQSRMGNTTGAGHRFDGCRQPGSTYKPIYYSLALEDGYGYDTRLNDKPITLVDPVTGAEWTPTNLHDTLDGDVTLEYALVFSKNLPSVDLFKRLGASRVENWARDLGFTTEIFADDALALGASCTLVPELAGAFALFARGGTWFPRPGDHKSWVIVRRVIDRDGNVVWDQSAPSDPSLPAAARWDRLAAVSGIAAKRVMTPRTAYLTTKLLAEMVTFGFTRLLKQTGIEAAGKTGTSSDTHDTWFIAFTERFITVAWLGDDKKKRALGKDDAAYMTAIPMWARFMEEAARDYPRHKLPVTVPDGVSHNDRGAHKKGETVAPMPLIYLSHDKPAIAPMEPGATVVKPGGAAGATDVTPTAVIPRAESATP